MNPREAIEAEELAEAETAYRHQLAREMYQTGQRADFEAGYWQANADEVAQWARIARPVVHGIPHAELEQRRWDLAAALTSQTRGPATSPAGPPSRNRDTTQNQTWRQAHDRHPRDHLGRPGDARAAGRRGERASVKVTAPVPE